MADFSITVSNSLSVSGPSPASVFGTAEFGSSLFGASGDGYFTVGKNLSESLSLASTVTAVALFVKALSETISLASAQNFGTLTDGSGYAYVFPNNITDIDSRYIPSWAETSEPTSSFSEVAEPTTTWTES